MRRASPVVSGMHRSWLTRADRDTQIKFRLVSGEPESRIYVLRELAAVDAERLLPGPGRFSNKEVFERFTNVLRFALGNLIHRVPIVPPDFVRCVTILKQRSWMNLSLLGLL